MPTTASHPFVCTECGKCFTRRSDLNRHALLHKPDAKRYYCAYPGCSHSSLQKGNLKTHYIAKHLLQRLFQCRFHGCPKSYTDESALIKHEKSHHRFFRRAQRPHERQMLPSVRLGLHPSVFVKDDSEQRVPSPTPSLCYSISDNSSPYSQPFSPAPAMAPAVNDGMHLDSENPVVPLSTDEFLHEMIPELFPKPVQTGTSSIPSIPPIPSDPSSNVWDAYFAYLLQEPYPTHLSYGEELSDPNAFSLNLLTGLGF
ncbi:uncharacterized protein FOMMEDRAFT_157315 [Fomitiporia mediterranea MF3/22]|uniref:uncharacterized protein n=1 Tax=Fomitiporia mediterranea (strain MF3/22) TaxID=694068 RepID=UPI0004409BD2|nr:uncharacterized protein FOMMEDRAFT_157315 [Fomitiporia mediterranea MF3/22]EJD02124.1 hypothetical protein FOMMEDRAFT_157315 [Fomitiporia mediterranea MF3/22]